MKVIILKTSEVKDVSLGYAVNYLLPKKQAIIATKIALEKLKKQEALNKDVKKKTKQEDRRLAGKLNGKVVTIKAKAGKAGKIHGSITKKEIAKELDILKTYIKLEKPIKKIGDYEVELKFGQALAKVKVKIEKI
ncbi:MAG: 50S ribosomal protein L9 [Candidatus Beckwithbacteria bacterium]|nr:50S ribosomal protein L9 [Patescibacteria group bacterium]